MPDWVLCMLVTIPNAAVVAVATTMVYRWWTVRVPGRINALPAKEYEAPTPPPPPTTEDDLREALQSFHVYAIKTYDVPITVLSHECGWKSSTAMPGPLLAMITNAVDHQAACRG